MTKQQAAGAAATTAQQAKGKIAEALKAIEAAKTAVGQALVAIEAVGVALNAVDRLESGGKLRVGEASVLGVVLTAAERHPALVAGHADSDGGVDPTRFETELLREWLDLHVLFAKAIDDIKVKSDAIAQLLGDTAKFYGARVRKPTLRVYADLSQLAEHNAALRKELADAIAYYGAIGRKGARTRAKNKTK